MSIAPRIPAARIVVFMPNWLGDGVMATPFLRALRGLYPAAHIAGIARPLVGPVLNGLPTVNDIHILQKDNAAATVTYLRANKFDLAISLPNSFRSAWIFFRARIPHRLGYARDWRSPLLTHRLHPERRSLESFKEETARTLFRNAVRARGPHSPVGTSELLRYESKGSRISYQAVMRDRSTGELNLRGTSFPDFGSFIPAARGFLPTPTIDYYLQLATYLGAENPSRKMELGITPEERTEAASVAVGESIVLVPGANFGSSKCWPAEYFARVADQLIEHTNATILIASSPAELPIVDAILAASRHHDRMIALAKLHDGKGLSLGALKELVRRSQLMICNDTGPRHFAAALGVPVVTLFGPTDPVWAETFSAKERQVRIGVPCGPCQLKKCPIDHRCMTLLKPELVLEAAAQLLAEERRPGGDTA
jgi:ADP-heptose:LPS heptosyltransferase